MHHTPLCLAGGLELWHREAVVGVGSVATAKAPFAILCPVSVGLDMANQGRQCLVGPIDDASTSRATIEPNWVRLFLAGTARHAAIAEAITHHTLIPDEVVLWSSPYLDTRVASPMVWEDDKVISPPESDKNTIR